MKKSILALLTILTISITAFAQTPEGIKYQAVVRDAGNSILKNHSVGMRMSILQDNVGGVIVYQEAFAPTTSAYGLVNLNIGNGTALSGDFSAIDWSKGPYFIEIAIDVNGGDNYVVMGTSQLMSVPYALHAKTADKVANDLVNDADADPSNEIQDLKLEGNILTVTNNDTATEIDLSLYLDNDNTQLTEAQVDAFVDNNGYLTSEVDGSVTNEIQDLQLVGNTLKITNNGSATVIDLTPYLDDTKLTEAQVDAFVDNNGYLTSEVDGSVTNEIQDLQLVGNTLKITNNGSATVIDLAPYLDDTKLTEAQVDAFVDNNGYLTSEVDGSVTNEIQDLQLVGNTLKITNNGSATVIDLTPYLDDTKLTEAQVDAFVGNNGYLTSEVDGSTTNEIQTISKSGSSITLSNGGGTVTTKADAPCFDNANRFVDCGNGTITDQLTGLIWLKNVGCFGAKNYKNGNDQAARLAHGQCGLTDNSSPGDWRLPTIEEWKAFMKSSCPSPSIPDITGNGCYADGPAFFTNMRASGRRSCISSSLNPDDLSQTQVANVDNGTTFGFPRATTGFGIWPVRDGRQ
ncbi:Lcl C-terminal domain-containing protein [Aureibacter tunicatorum]|uniref:Isochorismate hydrolase n=1 Tax=Aureibacter tunicatorum TaxID=866807 RepID=A0AAE3XMX9_9BACT|nr:DUF1566 domain-containing protein [Aureibacter tunicatorum]MDR6238898.1 isochorismate hydrolase [Aureibacter tunicatorum]BDD05175.1 hypothetical protein AUTU_26580 [Aureibacter tunicatorum]